MIAWRLPTSQAQPWRRMGGLSSKTFDSGDGTMTETYVHEEGMSPTIYIDADACPVTRDTMAVAKTRAIPVVLVANESQNLARYADREKVEILQVSSGRDSADFAMVARLAAGDIVVTADLGLAAMALAKGAHALSPRGRVYLAATIDAELAVRHAEQRHRRAGGRTGGPSPFLEEDRIHFRESLTRLLKEVLQTPPPRPFL
jgi:uncharacterized protein YaiI (UPF0178 family)